MGYGTVYINPPDHYAVGILGNNLHGTYWTYPTGSNKTYYYCETTGDGFKIGQLPDEFQGKSAYIYQIDENKQYVSNIEVTPPIEPTPLPTDAQSITTQPTPYIQPNTTASTSPSIAQPSVQPVLPLSFNLISENPIFFIIILFAIIASVVLAVWSVIKPKSLRLAESAPPEPSIQQESSDFSEGTKFCIFCGSSNKAYAAYCETCGKQIG